MTTIYWELGRLWLIAKAGKIATETEDVDALGNFEAAHVVCLVFAKNEGGGKKAL